MTPDLSVVIPLYRPNVRHLGELMETVESLRHTIGLSVDTVACITDAVTAVPTVPASTRVVVDRERGEGIAINWNLGVESAVGDIVLLIGQDDLLVDLSALEKGVRRLQQCGRLVALGSSRRLIHGDGQPEIMRRGDRHELWTPRAAWQGGARLSQDEIAMNFAVFGNVVGEPGAVLFRRSAWEMAGRFNESLRHTVDIDLWWRLAGAGDVAVWPTLCWYARRLHPDSATNANLLSGVAATERVASLLSFEGGLSRARARRVVVGGTLMYGIGVALRYLRRGQVRLGLRVTRLVTRPRMLRGALFVPVAALRRFARRPWGRPWDRQL